MLKRILGLLVVLSWLFALPCVAAELNYNAGPGQMMAKNLPDAVTDGTAKLVGPMSASQTMRVSIQLPIQNKAKLDQLVSDLYDPKSPNFHKWLTVEQVIAQFAPSQDDYNAVINFAESNGLKVEKQWPSRDNLGVSGTVANIEKAFNVKMNVYQHPTENRTFYSNDRTPVVNLPFPLAHVAGLDNYSIFRPVSQRQGTAQTSNATQQDPQTVAYTPSQIRTAYGLDSSNTGAGQTVGVFIVGGYNPTAITQFFSQYSIPYTGTITPIAIGSLTTTCTNGSCEIYNQAYSTEVEIDVEMVALMAPSANINVYCSQQGLDWSQAFEQMKADGNTVKVFSMSMAVSQDDPTDDVVLEEMAAQGQSLFVASGDGGPYSTSYHYTIWPAECHYVTDVGGTSLVLNADNTWNSEVVWNGSGGGYYPPDNIGIPSYQDPNIITPANGGSTTYRNIPDVAALADMRRVCVEAIPLVLQNGQAQIICSNGGPTGTSYAAPLWAGFLADTNQQAIADSLPVVGWINPTLYLLGVRSNYLAAFHDITSGSSTNNYGTFNATTGYDLTTGWGSPNGQGFMAAMLYASNINQFWFGAPYNANTGEYSLPGFGSFQLYPNGWINHDQLGWIWVSLPATLTDAWFWVSKMNTWVWFDLVNFPAIWSESDNSWLLYSEWTTNPSYFWNYNTQKWETY